MSSAKEVVSCLRDMNEGQKEQLLTIILEHGFTDQLVRQMQAVNLRRQGFADQAAYQAARTEELKKKRKLNTRHLVERAKARTKQKPTTETEDRAPNPQLKRERYILPSGKLSEKRFAQIDPDALPDNAWIAGNRMKSSVAKGPKPTKVFTYVPRFTRLPNGQRKDYRASADRRHNDSQEVQQYRRSNTLKRQTNNRSETRKAILAITDGNEEESQESDEEYCDDDEDFVPDLMDELDSDDSRKGTQPNNYSQYDYVPNYWPHHSAQADYTSAQNTFHFNPLTGNLEVGAFPHQSSSKHKTKRAKYGDSNAGRSKVGRGSRGGSKKSEAMVNLSNHLTAVVHDGTRRGHGTQRLSDPGMSDQIRSLFEGENSSIPESAIIKTKSTVTCEALLALGDKLVLKENQKCKSQKEIEKIEQNNALQLEKLKAQYGHEIAEVLLRGLTQPGYYEFFAVLKPGQVFTSSRKNRNGNDDAGGILDPTNAYQYTCPDPNCKDPKPRRSDYLKTHMASVHWGDIKPAKCPVCFSFFSTEFLLRRHLQSHVAEEDHLTRNFCSFRCNYVPSLCFFGCRTREALVYHITQKHMSREEMQAMNLFPNCSATFKTKVQAQAHYRKHKKNEANPPRCRYPDCDQSFPCVFMLRLHLKEAGHKSITKNTYKRKQEDGAASKSKAKRAEKVKSRFAMKGLNRHVVARMYQVAKMIRRTAVKNEAKRLRPRVARHGYLHRKSPRGMATLRAAAAHAQYLPTSQVVKMEESAITSSSSSSSSSSGSSSSSSSSSEESDSDSESISSSDLF